VRVKLCGRKFQSLEQLESHDLAFSVPELQVRVFPDSQNKDTVAVFREHYGTYLRLVNYSFWKTEILPFRCAVLCGFIQAKDLNAPDKDSKSAMVKAFKEIFRGEFATSWRKF